MSLNISTTTTQPQSYKLDLIQGVNELNNEEKSDSQKQLQLIINLLNLYYSKIEMFILNSNQQAMEYLRNDKKSDCLDLLKKSEKLLKSEYNQSKSNLIINKLLAITYNNLGCYYKQDEKPNVALKYLKNALMIEVYSIHDSNTIASTHLNICAILSRLNKHEIASEHAKISIELLDLAKNSIIKQEEIKQMNEQLENKLDEEKQKQLEQKLLNYKDVMNMLAISYYNLAIEQEYLKLFDKSLLTYQAGYQIALQELGNNHVLTKCYINNITKLQDNQQFKEQKEFAKIEKRQKQMDEGFHQFIKRNVKQENIMQSNSIIKQIEESYQKISPVKQKINLIKSRNASSISPNNNRIQQKINKYNEQQDSLYTIDNPLTKLLTNNNSERAQTVLKSRNDTYSNYEQRKRRQNKQYLLLDNNEQYIQNNDNLYNNSMLDNISIKSNKNIDSYINNNKKTLQPIKIINNESINYNNNNIQINQQNLKYKKIDKLPSIHQQCYDPNNYHSFEDNNTSYLQEFQSIPSKFQHQKIQQQYHTPQSKLGHKKVSSLIYDQKQNQTIDQIQNDNNDDDDHNLISPNKFEEQYKTNLNKVNDFLNQIHSKKTIHQNNTIDYDYEGYKINNDRINKGQNLKDYKLNKIKQRSNTVNIRDQKLINIDNKLNYQNINNLEDQQRNKNQLNINIQQSQINKNLNYNKNRLNYISENSDNLKKKILIQDSSNKLNQINNQQNTPNISLNKNNNIQKYQDCNLQDNDTLNDENSYETLNKYFKVFEQTKQNSQTSMATYQDYKNEISLKINSQTNNSERLTPYLQNKTISYNEKNDELIHKISKSEAYQPNQNSISPQLDILSQKLKSDQKQIIQNNNKSNKNNSKKQINLNQQQQINPNQKINLNIQQQKPYDQPNKETLVKSINRPDSHEDNSIDLDKRHKLTQIQQNIVNNNISFYRKKMVEIGQYQQQSQAQPQENIKKYNPSQSPLYPSVVDKDDDKNNKIINQFVQQ